MVAEATGAFVEVATMEVLTSSDSTGLLRRR